METILLSECVQIGFLQKAHGIYGEVILHFFKGFEDSIAGSSTFFIELNGLLVPYFTNTKVIHFYSSETAILKFDWIESEEDARHIIGNYVFLKKKDITNFQEKNNNYQKYNGYTVFDEIFGKIGIVKSTADFSGNIVFSIDQNGKEILIPFNESFVFFIDDNEKKISLKLPEGILDT